MPATILTSGNVAQINLAGEFDFSSQDELKQIFEKALGAAAQAIQINMQNTDFIDSSIIRLILKFHDTARKNKKSLVITNCSERIYEIFTIGGFDQVVDIQ
jgi:anti-anti-sigma factor